MFNDHYGLTDAVLNGTKTQTRRIVPKGTPIGNWKETVAKARFKVGEIVAVAQNYSTILSELEDPKNYACMELWEADAPKRAHIAGLCFFAGGTRKMFVAPSEMPHQVRIVGVRLERLQEISDEDCVKEGIKVHESSKHPQSFSYTYPNAPLWYSSPREAFALMIERILGKGSWASNPYVFVYDFELVK